MNQIDVRRVLQNEAERLQHIGRLTFSETFAAVNTEENMKKYLDEGFAFSKLKDELNQKNSEFYFAELGNKLIGYSKINVGQAQTEIRDEKALEIERIYVLREFHGKNVGKMLFSGDPQIQPEATIKSAMLQQTGINMGVGAAIYVIAIFVAFSRLK